MIQVIGVLGFNEFSGQYTNEDFFVRRNFIYDADNKYMIDDYVFVYALYTYFDSNNNVIGGSSIYMDAVRSCIDFVVMKIGATEINLE